MKHLNEAISKSMIKQMKNNYHCYLIIPVYSYTFLALTYGYESNYIKMKNDKSDDSPDYGCWVLSKQEFENYKKQFSNQQNDIIYEILSKETDPLKFVKYLKSHPSTYFKDTTLFKEITL